MLKKFASKHIFILAVIVSRTFDNIAVVMNLHAT